MTKACSVLAVLSLLVPGSAIAEDDPEVDTTEEAEWKAQIKEREAIQLKVMEASKDDTRLEAAKAELAVAVNIADRRKRAAAMRAIGSKHQKVRKEILAKASVDTKIVKRKLKTTITVKPKPRPKLVVRATPKGKGTDAVKPVTINDFKEQYTYKRECPDGGDNWQFKGEKTLVHASSTATNNDCTDVRGGKGGRVDVPEGTKTVEVTVDYVYDLGINIVTMGIYGAGKVTTGVRFESLAKDKIGSVMTPAGKVQVPVRFERVTEISKECDVLPYCETSTAGTARKTYFIDVTKAGPLTITPYVQVFVDADMIGAASADGTIKDIRPMKVTFHK
jgi:hypothetical protein